MLAVDIRVTRGTFTLEVALSARPGVLALFGRSGCGKTTLVNAIAGLLPHVEGRIALDDEVWLDSAAGLHVPAERRRIGYVFQDARLFPHYSVRANLEYGAKRAHAAVAGARAPAFDDVVALLGLAPLLERRPRHLSGGERQRVALGRALLSQPRLLLLDEPLASLDAARRDEVLPYFERLRDAFGIPMIFVSHQFDEVLRLATDVAVLEQGRLAGQGAPEAMSLATPVRAIVGPDAIGSVLTGPVIGVDPGEGLAVLEVAGQRLFVALPDARVGEQRRVQLLARDVVLATAEPRGVSVRNRLRGVVAQVTPDVECDLVFVDLGAAAPLVARITRAATRELDLVPGREVWALVKAISTRGHAY